MSEVPPQGYRQWPPADPCEETAAILARSARGPWDRIVLRATVTTNLTLFRTLCVHGEEKAHLSPHGSMADVLRRIPEVARVLSVAGRDEDAWVELQFTLEREGKFTVDFGDRDKPLPED